VLSRQIRFAVGLLAAVLALGAAPLPGEAQPQPVTVDYLLQKLFGNDNKPPYDLTADFTGVLTVTFKNGRLVVEAEGAFHEWRTADGAKYRHVFIRNLSVPLLLRPFAQSLRRTVAEKIEAQAENPEVFYAHDLFISAELPGNLYAVTGVHHALVDEAIDRYGKPEDKADPETRRRIAQWLFTSPTMHDFIVRPGPPYALQAKIDDTGLLHELTVYYDWGQVSTRIGFITVNGRTVWSEVVADTISTLPGIGQVTGQLSLNFSNHCMDCGRPLQQGTP
jgi:hypothetical protein